MTVSGVERVPPVKQDAPAGSATVWYVLLGFLAVIVAGVSVVVDGFALAGTDIEVYHGGAATVLDGGPLYDFASPIGMRFTYPPFAALLFAPLGLLPIGVAVGVWALVSTAALEAAIWILVGAAGVTSRRNRALLTFVGTVVALPLGPLSSNFWVGQINTILLLLVVADLLRGPGRFRGIGVGIAAGLKLTPLIFIPYLLLTRQIRAGLVATASFAGTVLISLVLLPADWVRYWFDALQDITRVIPVDEAWIFNQSMLATIKRIPGAPESVWFLLAAVVGLAGLAVAVLFRRRGDELAGIVACSVTGLLISPVSWPFHWVWCVPLLVLWARRAWRGDLVHEKFGVVLLWLAFAASSAWTFTVFLSSECSGTACQEATQPYVMKVLFADLFVIIGLAALVAMATCLRRTATAQVDQPSGSLA